MEAQGPDVAGIKRFRTLLRTLDMINTTRIPTHMTIATALKLQHPPEKTGGMLMEGVGVLVGVGDVETGVFDGEGVDV